MTQQQTTLRNSPASIAGGFFYLLSRTASLYHLLLLGVMRLYAITRPHQYRQLQSWIPKVEIGAVWIIAALIASVPGSGLSMY